MEIRAQKRKVKRQRQNEENEPPLSSPGDNRLHLNSWNHNSSTTSSPSHDRNRVDSTRSLRVVEVGGGGGSKGGQGGGTRVSSSASINMGMNASMGNNLNPDRQSTVSMTSVGTTSSNGTSKSSSFSSRLLSSSKKSKDRSSSAAKKKIVTKEDIGMPTNFQHLQHVGGNNHKRSQHTSATHVTSKSEVDLLEQMLISHEVINREDLQNPALQNIIQQFISSKGSPEEILKSFEELNSTSNNGHANQSSKPKTSLDLRTSASSLHRRHSIQSPSNGNPQISGPIVSLENGTGCVKPSAPLRRPKEATRRESMGIMPTTQHLHSNIDTAKETDTIREAPPPKPPPPPRPAVTQLMFPVESNQILEAYDGSAPFTPFSNAPKIAQKKAPPPPVPTDKRPRTAPSINKPPRHASVDRFGANCNPQHRVGLATESGDNSNAVGMNSHDRMSWALSKPGSRAAISAPFEEPSASLVKATSSFISIPAENRAQSISKLSPDVNEPISYNRSNAFIAPQGGSRSNRDKHQMGESNLSKNKTFSNNSNGRQDANRKTSLPSKPQIQSSITAQPSPQISGERTSPRCAPPPPPPPSSTRPGRSVTSDEDKWKQAPPQPNVASSLKISASLKTAGSISKPVAPPPPPAFALPVPPPPPPPPPPPAPSDEVALAPKKQEPNTTSQTPRPQSSNIVPLEKGKPDDLLDAIRASSVAMLKPASERKISSVEAPKTMEDAKSNLLGQIRNFDKSSILKKVELPPAESKKKEDPAAAFEHLPGLFGDLARTVNAHRLAMNPDSGGNSGTFGDTDSGSDADSFDDEDWD